MRHLVRDVSLVLTLFLASRYKYCVAGVAKNSWGGGSFDVWGKVPPTNVSV